MSKRIKKLAMNGLRISISGLALYFVIQSVSLDDRVVLADGSQTVTGNVTVRDDDVFVRSASGGTEVLPLAAVAIDENGAPRIQYGLSTAWRQSHKMYLIAAILAFSVVPVLQARRIGILLSAQGIQIHPWDTLKLSFAGNFLNFAAPLGSTAGDVFKAYYLSLHTARKTEAMTLVFLDRVIGLGTLVLAVSLITVLSPADGRLAPLRMYMLVMLLVGVFATVAYVSPPLRRSPALRRLAARLPMADQLARIDRTAVQLFHRKKALAQAIVTTLVLQVFAALSFFVVAMALGLVAGPGNALEYYAYFSTGEVVKALPGPPQGLGTMELAYGYLFASFGSASQILCAAFSIRVVTLICSLPGMIVTLTGSYRPADSVVYDTGGATALQTE